MTELATATSPTDIHLNFFDGDKSPDDTDSDLMSPCSIPNVATPVETPVSALPPPFPLEFQHSTTSNSSEDVLVAVSHDPMLCVFITKIMLQFTTAHFRIAHA